MHVSTCLVSSCPSFSFLCLLFPSLLSSLLSSLTGRFARVPVYVRLPVRVRRVHRDRGEGSASYVPLYVAGLSSRFSKKIHDVTAMIVDESNISRTPESPLLLGPSRISSTSCSALRFPLPIQSNPIDATFRAFASTVYPKPDPTYLQLHDLVEKNSSGFSSFRLLTRKLFVGFCRIY